MDDTRKKVFDLSSMSTLLLPKDLLKGKGPTICGMFWEHTLILWKRSCENVMKNMRHRTKYFFLYMESYITQKCILYCIISELYEKRWVNFCLTRVESGEEKIGKLMHLRRDTYLVLIINQMLNKGFVVSQNYNNLLTYNIFPKLQNIFNFRALATWGQKSKILMKIFFLPQTLKVGSTIEENPSKRRDSCDCLCVDCGVTQYLSAFLETPSPFILWQ